MTTTQPASSSSTRLDSTSAVSLPWHLAATLSERLQSGQPSTVDLARADRRISEWREVSGMDADDIALHKGLSALGVDEDQLRKLLGETSESLAARIDAEPPWHRTFAAWWNAGSSIEPDDRLMHGELGFMQAARPTMEGAAQQLQRDISARLTNAVDLDPILTDHDTIIDKILGTFPSGDLIEAMNRTLVLELNVARVQGRLDGDTPEARFASFLLLLQDPSESLAIWDEYVVLARYITDRLEYWIETRLELVDALIADLSDMRRGPLRDSDPQELTGIDFGAGDSHRRGRSVAILSFDHGKVVFKPRSLLMDRAFDDLLCWFNATSPLHQLRRIRIVERPTYGWVEFIDAGTTTDDDGGDRYAWRLGALTATLYLLHATDFHHENILAAGEDPILVDLEALLHTDKTAATAKVDGTVEIAAKTLSESVQSIGVLPNPLLMKDDDGTFGLDISALGGAAGQLTPIRVATWDGEGTDSMHLVTRRVEMDGSDNHPKYADGTEIPLLTRMEPFIQGFRTAYSLFAENKAELGGADGVIRRFVQARTRLIARATHVYGRLLLESTHPDFLRDALDRDRCLARLSAGHPDYPNRLAMIRGEIAEIVHGDVPMFTVDIGTGTMRSGAADEAELTAHTTAPIIAVLDRLADLDADGMEFQESVIRSSFASASMASDDARWPGWERPRDNQAVTSHQLTSAAGGIGRRLQDLALQDESSVGWIGLNLVDEKYWQLAACSGDTYVGTTGIALAIDAIAAVNDDAASAAFAQKVHAQAAGRALSLSRTLAATIRKEDNSGIGIGAFTPLGGTVFALAHAASRYQRPEFAAAAVALLPAIDLLIDEDISYDVVAGSAGGIMVMLALEAASPGCGALPIAHRMADRLVAHRHHVGDGCGWLTPINSEVPLAGFSHGASGIAVALARLNAVDPRPAYVDVVRAAIRYEQTIYDDELGNWRDLRPVSLGGKSEMTAWCHGAAGIALARAELLRLEVVPELAADLRAELERAMQSTIRTGIGDDPVHGIGNHSLCHGDVGNLLIAERALDHLDGYDKWKAVLSSSWRTLVHEGTENRWLSGVPDGVETPGLMTGIAGIGWGLARRARPDLVPDVLTLEAPSRSVGCPRDER